MRHKLEQIDGKRIQVFAEVGRFGTKSSYKGYPKETICFIDLKNAIGEPLCDHVWFTSGKRIQELGLSVGDKVSFFARVSKYVKGYRGNRDDMYDAPPVSIDYKLNNPTQIVIVQ